MIYFAYRGSDTVTKLQYNMKSDTLFKLLFSKNQELLKRLVSALLSINYEDITHFIVINPEISPEELGKKFCRLDINMEVNNQKLDLELQVLSDFWDNTCTSRLTCLPSTIIFMSNLQNFVPISSGGISVLMA